MTTDNHLLSIYQGIFSSDTEQELVTALTDWWSFLNEICTEDNPCSECRREREREGP